MQTERNKAIRNAIRRNGVRHYDVARYLGISQYTLSHWLQNELPSDKKAKILNAIERCSNAK